MGEYQIKALTSETWGAFADLCERHNGGGFGDCWCCWFHNCTSAQRREAGGGDWRAYKQRLVGAGKAHAALVFDGDAAVGWCEYGTPEELPFVFHRKEVEAAGLPLPDYRLTCFMVDRRYRRRGVATAALDGALELIAAAGGGVVETYPQDTGGKKISASFLYNATRSMFERAGFTYEYAKGKNHCVMRKVVAPAAVPSGAGARRRR
jgi:ribosomal protein S18 acetylase RimI-like enzyme